MEESTNKILDVQTKALCNQTIYMPTRTFSYIYARASNRQKYSSVTRPSKRNVGKQYAWAQNIKKKSFEIQPKNAAIAARAKKKKRKNILGIDAANCCIRCVPPVPIPSQLRASAALRLSPCVAFHRRRPPSVGSSLPLIDSRFLRELIASPAALSLSSIVHASS